jgi:hypothetical protein
VFHEFPDTGTGTAGKTGGTDVLFGGGIRGARGGQTVGRKVSVMDIENYR